MIITTSEELRNLTGSFYANNDFGKIENTIMCGNRYLPNIGYAVARWVGW